MTTHFVPFMITLGLLGGDSQILVEEKWNYYYSDINSMLDPTYTLTLRGREWAENRMTTSSRTSSENLASSLWMLSTKAYEKYRENFK